MKPKEALVKDGFLPAGSENVRGRLSGAAIERCMELSAQGWDIDGYTRTASTGPEPVKVEKVAVDPNRVLDVPDPARDEREWIAVLGDGTNVGIRTICNSCGSSLNYCRCAEPRVWVDHETQGLVYFKPKPN